MSKHIVVPLYKDVFLNYLDSGIKLIEKERQRSFRRMDKYNNKIKKRVLSTTFNFPDEKEEEEIKKKLNAKDFKEWEKENLEGILIIAEIRNFSEFEDSFFKSFVIYAYSKLEITLNEVCSEIKSDIGLKDLRGSGIARARLFLKKIGNFKLPDEKLSRQILDIGLIRNALAHNGGQTTKELLPVLKRNKLLKWETDQTLFFDEKYCKYVVRIIHRYLSSLIKLNGKVFMEILI